MKSQKEWLKHAGVMQAVSAHYDRCAARWQQWAVCKHSLAESAVPNLNNVVWPLMAVADVGVLGHSTDCPVLLVTLRCRARS